MNKWKLIILILLLITGKTNIFSMNFLKSWKYPIHAATEKGDLEKLIELTEKKKYSPHTKDNQGNTILHLACKHSHIDIIKYLLSNKINLDNDHTKISEQLENPQALNITGNYNKNKKSPLALACMYADQETIEYLFTVYPELVNQRDKHSMTPIHYTCITGNRQALVTLLHLFDTCIGIATSSGETPVEIATKYLCKKHNFIQYLQNEIDKNITICPLLIKAENTEGARQIMNRLGFYLHNKIKNEDNNTILHRAAQMGSLELITHFFQVTKNFKKKISIIDNALFAKNNDGDTPLDVACKYKHKKVVIDLAQRFKEFRKNKKDVTNSAFHDAFERGKLRTVAYFIEELKYSIEERDKNENTPLLSACSCGQTEIVEYLLEKDANLEAYNKTGNSPLCLAAARGHIPVIRKILNKRIDLLEERDRHYNTLLHYACCNGHLDVVKLLIEEYNMQVQYIFTLRSLARENKHTEIETYLKDLDFYKACKEGDEVQVKHFIEYKDYSQNYKFIDGNTPLHIACIAGYLAMAKYLIDHPNIYLVIIKNKQGDIPIDSACNHEHYDIATLIAKKLKKRIINFNIDTKKETSDKYLAIRDASARGKVKTVEFLLTQNLKEDGNEKDELFLQAKAKETRGHMVIVNSKKKTGKISANSPLGLACEHGKIETIILLLSKQPELASQVDEQKYAPIHYASYKGQLEVVKLLVRECNADIDIHGKNGEQAIDFAKNNKHTKVVDYLKQAKIERINNYYEACQEGNLNKVKIYIEELKYSPNIKFENNNTPLHIACANRHVELAKYLINYHTTLLAPLNNNEQTPLDIAVEQETEHIIRAFKEPLCQTETLKTIRHLVEHMGYKIGYVDASAAIAKNNVKKVSYFAYKNKDLLYEIDNIGKRTILHEACRKNKIDIVKELVEECNADITIADKDGKKPIEMTTSKQIRKYLKKMKPQKLDDIMHFQVPTIKTKESLNYEKIII